MCGEMFKTQKVQLLFNNGNHFSFKFHVYLTVAGKLTAIGNMATELTDQRLILEFLEQISHKSSASHVTARNLIDRSDLLLSRD